MTLVAVPKVLDLLAGGRVQGEQNMLASKKRQAVGDTMTKQMGNSNFNRKQELFEKKGEKREGTKHAELNLVVCMWFEMNIENLAVKFRRGEEIAPYLGIHAPVCNKGHTNGESMLSRYRMESFSLLLAIVGVYDWVLWMVFFLQ